MSGWSLETSNPTGFSLLTWTNISPKKPGGKSTHGGFPDFFGFADGERDDT